MGAGSVSLEKGNFRFYRSQDMRNRYLPDYGPYDWKQTMHMTHLEPFLGERGKPEAWFLFDYRRRDPITGNAGMIRIAGNMLNSRNIGK